MNSPIILIGPMSAGKSTIGELLAQKLNLPQHSLDEKRWDYYAEIGYDSALAAEIANSDQGKPGLLRYWKPFEAHAVERMLAAHPEGIIDFGAGHSVAVNEQFVRHPSNHRLATMVIYTKDKTPEESCAEIIQKLGHNGIGS